MALSKSKHSNFPHNTLHIHLHSEPNHVYTARDLVRGVVRCDPTARPQRVSISFKGACTIYDKSEKAIGIDLFRDCQQDLFVSDTSDNYDILRGGPIAEDGKVELPFEFTFPRTVRSTPDPDRNWSHSQDPHGHPRFQHSPGFLLPPSCAAHGPTAPIIAYFLEAQIDSVPAVRQELRYFPPAPEYSLSLLQPNSGFGSVLPKHSCRYKFIRTRKLLPGYKEKSRRLEKMKDYLVAKELFFGIETFDEIPFAKFDIFTTPPRVIVIGSNFPIHVCIKHLDRSMSVPEPPQIFIRRLRVQLICNYDMFVPRPKSARSASAEHVDRVRHTVTLADKKIENKEGTLLFDGQNLRDLVDLQLPKTDDTIVPSFTSYGLTLEHELQVEIWGECATTEFSGITCRDSIQVVSGWTVGHLQEGTAEGAVPMQEAPPPSEFPPPPYEMHK